MGLGIRMAALCIVVNVRMSADIYLTHNRRKRFPAHLLPRILMLWRQARGPQDVANKVAPIKLETTVCRS